MEFKRQRFLHQEESQEKDNIQFYTCSARTLMHPV